jgi:hypothetical protein
MSTALKFSSLGVHRFVREQFEASLRPAGFSFDLARGMWRRSLDGDIEHIVTLPTDIADNIGPVVVTANLGVHCRTLARRLAQTNEPRRAINLATFMRNVGQLSARRAWRDWVIRDLAGAERVARRLAARVVSVGLPWLGRYGSLSTVRDGFVAFGREDHREFAVPELERLLAEDALAEKVDDEAEFQSAGRSPAILPMRFDQAEVAWHCDE